MSAHSNRRTFLKTAAAGAVLGLGDLSFLSRLRPVSAAEAKLDPKLVRLDSDIEPVVRLLEETPRDRLLEEVAARIHKGLNYRELLAALLLAGVRNVQPRPVGFKFHAVLVVNSAHLASIASPDSDRWLPIFWALDYFKDSQAATARETGWRMGPLDESKVPSARKARQAFVEAMDSWDEGAADVAVAGLARSAGANEVFELFVRYGRAISATLGTRRSSSRIVGERFSASVGSMPSRCCGRWRTPCKSMAMTIRRRATRRRIGRGDGTRSWPRRFKPSGKKASRATRRRRICSRCCARVRMRKRARRSSRC